MEIYDNWINGTWLEPARRMETTTPFTGEAWATVADDPAAVDTAVAAARVAFDGEWGAMSGAERGRCMRRLGELLTRDAEMLGQIESRDNGKIIRETGAQAKSLQGYFDFFAGLADKIGGEKLPDPGPNFLVYTEHVPVGVVGAIIPWNSPLALLTWKLGPLLAAGCTAVVKPSDITPVTALLLAERATEAGFPDGVINIVTGGPDVGAAISSHPGIDKITFTGGGATARHVARAAAANLTPLVLELGGKSPQIVFDDADLDAATNGILAGIFAASGQTCVAGSRAYVHEGIAEKIIQRVTERAETIKLGDPADVATEMGPAASDAQRDRIIAMIEQARAEGATVAAGGVLIPDSAAVSSGRRSSRTSPTRRRSSAKRSSVRYSRFRPSAMRLRLSRSPTTPTMAWPLACGASTSGAATAWPASSTSAWSGSTPTATSRRWRPSAAPSNRAMGATTVRRRSTSFWRRRPCGLNSRAQLATPS